jgi:hypothetical protein
MQTRQFHNLRTRVGGSLFSYRIGAVNAGAVARADVEAPAARQREDERR